MGKRWIYKNKMHDSRKENGSGIFLRFKAAKSAFFIAHNVRNYPLSPLPEYYKLIYRFKYNMYPT